MWFAEGGGMVAFFAAPDAATAKMISHSLLRVRGNVKRATFVEESIWLQTTGARDEMMARDFRRL